MEEFKKALQHYADFSGRATRKDYWMFFLFYMILYIVAMVVDGVLAALIGLPILTLIFALGMLVPSLSCAVRRLHDTSRSGWWVLISLVPLVGGIILIVFLVQDSHDDNQYGPNPKSAQPAEAAAA